MEMSFFWYSFVRWMFLDKGRYIVLGISFLKYSVVRWLLLDKGKGFNEDICGYLILVR